jgi:translation initiation factor 1
MTDNSRLVYSTEGGPIQRPRGNGGDAGASASLSAKAADGIVRVTRGEKGGKTVTTTEGVPSRGEALEKIASELKRRCSAGGSVKDGVIILQGDHRQTVVSMLQEKGYRVKIAGG